MTVVWFDCAYPVNVSICWFILFKH